MSCFSCGQTFNGNINELLQLFKREFLERGTERYFYKESSSGDVKIVKKEQFNTVFENDIKPNFKKGAEYAHISEYNAK